MGTKRRADLPKTQKFNDHAKSQRWPPIVRVIWYLNASWHFPGSRHGSKTEGTPKIYLAYQFDGEIMPPHISSLKWSIVKVMLRKKGNIHGHIMFKLMEGMPFYLACGLPSSMREPCGMWHSSFVANFQPLETGKMMSTWEKWCWT